MTPHTPDPITGQATAQRMTDEPLMDESLPHEPLPHAPLDQPLMDVYQRWQDYLAGRGAAKR